MNEVIVWGPDRVTEEPSSGPEFTAGKGGQARPRGLLDWQIRGTRGMRKRDSAYMITWCIAFGFDIGLFF